MKNIHAFTKKIGNRPPQIGIFSSSEAAFSRANIESWLFTVTISCERTGQTKEMFRVESIGKPCPVSEEHFPGREKLARFPRNISPSGKTLLGFRGTFSRVGKPCSVPGEHFPGREIPRCVLRQAFNDSMLVAVISCSPTSGRMRYAPTLSGEILTQNCTIHYRALNEQMVNM